MTAATEDERLPLADGPLGRTIAPVTDIWNDSCAVDELEYALSNDAVGAAANPTIVVKVWNNGPARWRARIGELARERPTVSDLAWAIVEVSFHRRGETPGARLRRAGRATGPSVGPDGAGISHRLSKLLRWVTDPLVPDSDVRR